MKLVKKLKLSGKVNFFLAILLIYFLFFGYICNMYRKGVGMDLIFLNRILINPQTYFSVFILIFIVSLLNLREHFYEYGIRNSIWLVPIIILISWFWYWFIYGFDIGIIGIFFISLEGYFTILLIFVINFLTAILVSFLKQSYRDYIMKE
jgi:hypothetical protein